jgi:hypothetical protein
VSVTVFGVRHHGPGSARSLARALETLEPDALLVEGPPEGDAIAALAGSEAMRPPVALLVYAPEEPRRAVFYPFASFSPEWQALRYALAHELPFRFIDLAATHWLGEGDGDTDDETDLPGEDEREEHEGREADEGRDEEAGEREVEMGGERRRVRRDPLGELAKAAGHDDAERWWEDVVEHRRDELAAFEAVAEAMGALREGQQPESAHEARREAHMRRAIRAAQREGFERIAVVCGAWHVPALTEMPTATSDNALLKGLPKTKVAATWVPWTYDRLSYASGYGAGVVSPGWYDHLFTTEDDVIVRWLTKTARLLRADDVDISSAHVLEATRTAEALAALRGRPLAGLPEIVDATEAVIGTGADSALALVRERLIVGQRLGEVPEATPAVPLQADVARAQRRLRLKPEAAARRLDLDLRKDNDRARSHLLHRLNLLGIAWGAMREAIGARGTFHELWDLEWLPEFAVRLIEASMYGTTLPEASTAFVRGAVAKTTELRPLTQLVEATLLAELPAATVDVMRALEARAAVGSDVAELMEALPPLARVVRYGNVRATDVAAVAGVVDGLMVRITIGLAGAVASLDDEAAGEMAARIADVHGALALLERADLREQWQSALAAIVARADVHGLVGGRSARLLLDGGALSSEAAARRFSLVLSPGTLPAHAAAWIEGFLTGGGLVLVHDEALLGVLDDWIAGVGEDAFGDALPVLRRTFATFATAERRQIGARLKRGARAASAAGPEGDLDHERAALVLPLLRQILGVADA